MTLKLYNSLVRRKEVFEPLESGRVRMYNCGPTVYNYAHIGNYRAFMLADLLHRYLEFGGYDVFQVMNITDVGHLTDDADEGEDKVEAAARKEKIDPYQVVDRYIRAFMEDIEALNMLKADVYPRATDHIPEMIEIIEALVDNGHAYRAGACVYFDVSTFADYGKLSGNTLDKLRAGARVDVHPDKRSPFDFALWKEDPNHLMQWDSPWGRGFPGWHIECSAMSMKYLGDTFDIHTGGEDNVFPHHECEIAQSEGASGKPFVRYWLHTRHLLVDKKKMSKSEGNFYTLRDLTARGYSGRAIRYALLSNHYRQPYNLTFQDLDASEKAVEKVNDFVRNLDDRKEEGEACPGVARALEECRAGFVEAMDDDLNISEGLGKIGLFRRAVNKEPFGKGDREKVRALMLDLDRVLGILQQQDLSLDQKISAKVEERERARREKDFQRADAIRDELLDAGIVLEDTPDGVRWKRG